MPDTLVVEKLVSDLGLHSRSLPHFLHDVLQEFLVLCSDHLSLSLMLTRLQFLLALVNSELHVVGKNDAWDFIWPRGCAVD